MDSSRIVNTYAADGTKLRSVYKTNAATLMFPLGHQCEQEHIDYLERTVDYCGSVRYEHDGTYQNTIVYNTEGYHIAHMKTAHFVHILILFTIGLFGCTRCNYKTIPDSTWVEIKDGEMVDSYVRRGDNIYFNIFDFYGIKSDTYDSICIEHQEPISTDAAHFSVCKGTGYARDLEHVYYPPANIYSSDSTTPNESECDEFYLMGSCIVEHAIPKDFKYVKDGYGIDRRNMFRYGILIEWDDSIFETE